MNHRKFNLRTTNHRTGRIVRSGASEIREGLSRAVSLLRATHGTPNDAPLPQDHPTRPRNHPGSRNCAGIISGRSEFYFLSDILRKDEIREADHDDCAGQTAGLYGKFSTFDFRFSENIRKNIKKPL